VTVAPTAKATLIQRFRASDKVRLAGSLGGAGPLQYRYTLGIAAPIAWVPVANPFSVDLNFNRSGEEQKLLLEVMQGDGQITPFLYSLPPRVDDDSPRGRTDDGRAGSGGVAVVGRRFITEHTYLRDGSVPLIDTDVGGVTTDLKAADGVKLIESTRGAAIKAARVLVTARDRASWSPADSEACHCRR
jgi:hypothetical protein